TSALRCARRHSLGPWLVSIACGLVCARTLLLESVPSSNLLQIGFQLRGVQLLFARCVASRTDFDRTFNQRHHPTVPLVLCRAYCHRLSIGIMPIRLTVG